MPQETKVDRPEEPPREGAADEDVRSGFSRHARASFRFAFEHVWGPMGSVLLHPLALVVYYRYLPTYQPIAVEPQPTHTSPDDVVVEIL